jgi:hypothetical protein
MIGQQRGHRPVVGSCSDRRVRRLRGGHGASLSDEPAGVWRKSDIQVPRRHRFEGGLHSM